MQEKIDTSILHSGNKNLALRQRKIQDVRKYGIVARGQVLLIKHYQQQKLSASQAIKAYCYQCMGLFEDGKGDCGDTLCPLYSWFPYKNSPLADANRALPAKNSEVPACSLPHLRKSIIEGTIIGGGLA